MPPSYMKRIICLANSRKISGRCVAGKEIGVEGVGHWVRPVSHRPNGEVSLDERRYENGSDVTLLDVVDIPMKQAHPHAIQPENHLIDDEYYWRRVRSATDDELIAALDQVTGPLWDNASSSYNGLKDRVDDNVALKQGKSLKLIVVEDLVLSVSVEGAEFGNGKRRVRGRFTLNGHQYLLSVTDPKVERERLAQPDGQTEIGRAILCVSLGDRLRGIATSSLQGCSIIHDVVG